MQARSSPQLRKLLERIPLFAKLGAGELDDLVKIARVRFVRPKQEVFHEGDPGQQVYVVIRGQLRVVTASGDGRDMVLAILGPEEVIGEVALLDGRERTATVIAAADCELLAIDRLDLIPFLEAHPKVAVKLLEAVASRLRRLDQHMTDTVFLSVPARLAKRIVQLGQEHGKPAGSGIAIDLKLSQQELANMVGTTRETVNKQIRAWEKDGVLAMAEGRIRVLRPRELEAIAGLMMV